MKVTETVVYCDNSKNCDTHQVFNGFTINEQAKKEGWILAGNLHFCSTRCKLVHRDTRLIPPKRFVNAG